MATPEYAAGPLTARRPEISVRGFPARRAGWIDWVTTTDHKKIGILYFFTTVFFFLLGGVEALLMRIQLGSADSTFLDADDLQPAVHDARHDDDLPVRRSRSSPAFANYLVPLMIGARDMAFPRLNMLSWWLLVLGGTVLYTSLFFSPPAPGWTSYAPLSDDAFMPGARHRRVDRLAAPGRASPRSSARSTSSSRSTTCGRRACRSAACRCSSGRS